MKTKAKTFAFKKFLLKKKSHSKIRNIHYQDLEMQDYLQRKDLSIEDKKMLFRWRVRMERFGENFRGSREFVLCPLCGDHRDSELLSFSCEAVNREISIECKYDDIFSQKIENKTIRTISKIMSLRNKIPQTENNENK